MIVVKITVEEEIEDGVPWVNVNMEGNAVGLATEKEAVFIEKLAVKLGPLFEEIAKGLGADKYEHNPLQIFKRIAKEDIDG